MRVSLLSLAVIIGSLLLASGAILLSLWFARRRRDARLREHGKPMLVMPFGAAPEVPRAPVVRDLQPPVRRSPITALAVAQRLTPDEYLVTPTAIDEQAVVTTGDAVRHGEVAELIQGRTVRFHRVVDPALAVLPGWLEVAEGADAGMHLSFIQLPDMEEPVVTFGRSEGPPYRHVQLLVPTVSRMHARIAYDGGDWFLTNLSRTNPVSLNGTALDDEEGHLLRDGDLIEMGTVSFRYHTR